MKFPPSYEKNNDILALCREWSTLSGPLVLPRFRGRNVKKSTDNLLYTTKWSPNLVCSGVDSHYQYSCSFPDSSVETIISRFFHIPSSKIWMNIESADNVIPHSRHNAKISIIQFLGRRKYRSFVHILPPVVWIPPLGIYKLPGKPMASVDLVRQRRYDCFIYTLQKIKVWAETLIIWITNPQDLQHAGNVQSEHRFLQTRQITESVIGVRSETTGKHPERRYLDLRFLVETLKFKT